MTAVAPAPAQLEGPAAASESAVPVRSVSRLFAPLYMGLVATQALDVHSTLRALNAGHREANPMMRWATSHPATLVSFKTAATIGTTFLLQRVRKEHPKRAVILLAAMDTAYAFVVAHNYSAPVPRH
jgi:hypothetical protein